MTAEDKQRRLWDWYFGDGDPIVIPEPVLTVFGDSPPPGTYGLFTDGGPNIRTSVTFYQYANRLPAGEIVGARAWVPEVPPSANQLRLMLWVGDLSMASAPDREMVVDVLASGWVSATFPSPVPVPANGEDFKIGVEWVGNDDIYVYAADGRVIPPQPGLGVDAGICVSETLASYRIGAGAESLASDTGNYGLDVRFTEGVVDG